MTSKDFWRNSSVTVVGAGAFGTVLANHVAANCSNVRMLVRGESRAREINSSRTNVDYVPELNLSDKVLAVSEPDRAFESGVQAVIWALPSKVCRDQARAMAKYFTGEEIVLHATKGIEQGTLKRISTVLGEELPCPRIGVISGPNLAYEIARGDPAGTVVASRFDEVISAGEDLLSTDGFRVYGARDVVGVEWAGTLKNVLALASGALDALGLGWNARAMLLTRGLAEMVRFGSAMGAEQGTFLGLAGVGDLVATCSSSLSRNYSVGFQLGKGHSLEKIIEDFDSTAEGISTTRIVHQFAKKRGIQMPITEGVYYLISGKMTVREALHFLMTHPLVDGI